MLNHNVYGEPTTADNYLMDARPNEAYAGWIYMSPYIDGFRYWRKPYETRWHRGNPENWLDSEITSKSFDEGVKRYNLYGKFYINYFDNKLYDVNTINKTATDSGKTDLLVQDPVINKLIEDDFTDATIITTITSYCKVSYNGQFKYFTGLSYSGGYYSASTVYEMNYNPIPSNAQITVNDSRTATFPTFDDTVSIGNNGDGSHHVLQVISNGGSNYTMARFAVNKSWYPDTDGIAINDSESATSEGALTFEYIIAKTSEIIRG